MRTFYFGAQHQHSEKNVSLSHTLKENTLTSYFSWKIHANGGRLDAESIACFGFFQPENRAIHYKGEDKIQDKI